MNFDLKSSYKPTGDQPRAIHQLVDGVEKGQRFQTLLGVTGSGKTFTAANVIAEVNKPTLVLSHNKTLAAQLYGEFKSFFPNNAVEYFVSYYDFYQPEAYLPTNDLYIAKDMSINDEIEKLRLRTTTQLLSGRRDIIVVASVSCIYGMSNPKDYASKKILIRRGEEIERDELLHRLVQVYYTTAQGEFKPGTFRSKGDTIDIFPAVEDYQGIAYRVEMWGDEIDRISSFVPLTGEEIEEMDEIFIYPSNLFVTTKEQTDWAKEHIKMDLEKQTSLFEQEGKKMEADRLYERVTNDLAMLEELGYCSGIENYSRYFDGRQPGERPYCLLDYFPDDYLMIIDESHVTIPQVRGMYGGDRQRKENLVSYGFRLPAAIDNRPLKFDEFEMMQRGDVIYVSATPGDYELEKSDGIIVEQLIRPTGLLDPRIEVRPTTNQIDDLVEEITQRIERNERVLVTTLTKRMAEELAEHLADLGIKTEYLHSEVVTIRRVEIMEGLRRGDFDVLVGVNLLREGLDLPEVSLVAILDADKEGFLRNHRSLTQTAGRAARNVNGLVIFYADKITESMQKTIDETERRRSIQMAYNEAHGITPHQAIKSSTTSILDMTGPSKPREVATPRDYRIEKAQESAAEKSLDFLKLESLSEKIEKTREAMQAAAKALDFVSAAQLRDLLFELQAQEGGSEEATELEKQAAKRISAREHERAAHAANKINKRR